MAQDSPAEKCLTKQRFTYHLEALHESGALADKGVLPSPAFTDVYNAIQKLLAQSRPVVLSEAVQLDCSLWTCTKTPDQIWAVIDQAGLFYEYQLSKLSYSPHDWSLGVRLPGLVPLQGKQITELSKLVQDRDFQNNLTLLQQCVEALQDGVYPPEVDACWVLDSPQSSYQKLRELISIVRDQIEPLEAAYSREFVGTENQREVESMLQRVLWSRQNKLFKRTYTQLAREVEKETNPSSALSKVKREMASLTRFLHHIGDFGHSLYIPTPPGFPGLILQVQGLMSMKQALLRALYEPLLDLRLKPDGSFWTEGENEPV